MKKLLSIILALALFAAMSVTAFAAGAPARLLVLGDSISAGVGLTDETQRYGDLLADHYNIAAGSYTNKAVSGATSADLVSKMDEL